MDPGYHAPGLGISPISANLRLKNQIRLVVNFNLLGNYRLLVTSDSSVCKRPRLGQNAQTKFSVSTFAPLTLRNMLNL